MQVHTTTVFLQVQDQIKVTDSDLLIHSNPHIHLLGILCETSSELDLFTQQSFHKSQR